MSQLVKTPESNAINANVFKGYIHCIYERMPMKELPTTEQGLRHYIEHCKKQIEYNDNNTRRILKEMQICVDRLKNLQGGRKNEAD